MKQLILVRHAKTEPLSGSLNDFDRKLKKRGFIDAQLVSEELTKNKILPELIISSPAARAMQTAEIMADAFGITHKSIVVAPFIYDGHTTAGFLDGIATLADEKQSVMVVGHNPDMAMLSMKLTGENFYNFPTTATTVISFSVENWYNLEPGKGSLELFLFPKMLKA